MKILTILLCVGYASAFSKGMINKNPKTLTGLRPEDKRFVEGDMVMTGIEEEHMRKGLQSATVSNLWPKQGSTVTIPYENRSPAASSAIQRAIADYERNTCIRFRKKGWNDRAYISFYDNGGGCHSPVGYTGGRNSIELSQRGGCLGHETVLHEIGHSLGLLHEQARFDRDKYITILWNNISPSSMKSQFQISHGAKTHGLSYDYLSMMHYGEWAFARKGTVSIRTKDPSMQRRIGRGKGFSPTDIKKINLLYNCGSSTGGGSGGGGGGGSGCSDNDNRCPGWTSYCNNPKNKDWMSKNCKKSCGLCGGGGGSSCRDIDGRCSGWKSYCNNPRNKYWMTKNCAKTCNKC